MVKKSVFQYTLEGVFLKKYNSIGQAAKANKTHVGCILSCCNNKTTNAGGYVWRFDKVYVEPILKNNIPSLDGEEWRDIVGLESLYAVSNYGRVWSKKRITKNNNVVGGKIIKPSIDKRPSFDRYTIYLKIADGKYCRTSPSRLVAKAFIPNPHNLPQVNHKDENPLNNHVSNLEWCTAKYNCNYGTRMQRIKEKQNVPILQYTLDGKFIAEYESMHIAAEAIKADAGHICDCCIGNRRFAYGYFWRYKNEQLYQRAKQRINEKMERSKKSRADKFTARALNVVQLDMKGNYIALFPSTRIAAEHIRGHRSHVINCCNGKSNDYKGYKWIYEKDYHEPDIVKGVPQQLTLF